MDVAHGQEIISRLEKSSTWFNQLKPSEKLFVSEYCTNGFDGNKAVKVINKKVSSQTMLDKAPVQEAIQEFVTAVLADRASKVEAKITDVLWRRAFYNPMDFIDSKGQPKTADGKPFNYVTFNMDEYKKRLGPWAVCIDAIKPYVHPKNPDIVTVVVELADRDKALKALSTYAGMVKEEENTSQEASSFVVNLNIQDHQQPKEVEVQDYKKIDI